MKANFTSAIRNFFLVTILSLAFTTAFSQNSLALKPATANLKAVVENNTVILNWNVTEGAAFNYCKVQASADGITFYTIGMVLGPNPEQTGNSFSFKQNLAKIRPGQAYYRVLNMETDEIAHVSNVAKVL
jgi:hypothetical protein